MNIKIILLFISLSLFAISCKREDVPSNNSNQVLILPKTYSATTICTTYTASGSILAMGTPFNYTVRLEGSTRAGFDYHLINATGDSDTTVYAVKMPLQGEFTIPSQQFKTSTNVTLTMTGQGVIPQDSLKYSWSFFTTSGTVFKSHDCNCKAKSL